VEKNLDSTGVGDKGLQPFLGSKIGKNFQLCGQAQEEKKP